MVRSLIVVPARRRSMRLSDKMLRKLGGKELILWSYESALSCARSIDSEVDVVVACDDLAIARCVEGAGGRAIMTSSELSSGSDRVWSALRELEGEGEDGFYDIVINYQGDLPRCEPSILRDGLAVLRASGADISTPIVSVGESVARRATIVKTIFARPSQTTQPPCASPSQPSSQPSNETGVIWHRAMFFTRAFAPCSVYGSGVDLNEYHQHIGIYIYRRAALERFVSLPPSYLEQRERLEQLRALENGLTIAVFPIASAPVDINLEADLASFEQQLFLSGEIDID